MIDKDEVGRILTELGDTADKPVDAKGNLDVKAFNQLKQTKQVVKQLKELGVDNKWLRDKGFQIAAMILHMYDGSKTKGKVKKVSGLGRST